MTGLDHVGFTVSNLDRSIEFYQLLLQTEPMLRRRYTEQYVADVVGYHHLDLDAAFFKIGGTRVILELLQYILPPGAQVDMETYNTGNGHLCLIVADLAAEYERLRPHGVAFRRPEPMVVPIGPYQGGKICYLRDPDGISVELLELPPDGVGPDFSGAKG
jgi:catechol 2,3-dioxygenase-like lactoylglutathione lyase family enzyme